jgi:hypothetical protein
MESIVGLATHDGFVLAGIYDHLVPANRYFDAFLAKDVPKFLDERFDSIFHKVGIKLRCVFVRTVDILEAEVRRRTC